MQRRRLRAQRPDDVVGRHSTITGQQVVGRHSSTITGQQVVDSRFGQWPVGQRSEIGAGQARPNRELIDAAWKNDVKAARTLIKAGADVNAKDASEQSAFLIAASEGYLELLELTLDSGANVDSLDSYRGTALIRAAERGHADIVGRLLQSKIEVDHVNRLGWTALHEAIWLGKETTSYADTVRLLVAGGADINLAARTDGRSPLVMARERGFGQVETTIRRSSKAATRAEN